jgi:hypothetical protein
MKIYDQTNKELMKVASIEAVGGELVIKGKIFGAMLIVAKLTPAEARAGLKLLSPATLLFLLTLLFRPALKRG